MSKDQVYRTAYLQGREFTRMPTAAEQRAQALEREAKLKAEAEADLSRRSRLAVPISINRKPLTRSQIFSALRRFMTEEK
jgi:hypothetical protein